MNVNFAKNINELHMQEPLRLFDLIDRRNEMYADRGVFVNKDKATNTWHKHSAAEYRSQSDAISYALLHLGVKRGENVALISSGRPEWNYIDMGVQQVGAVLVPIYPTISEEDYLYILSHAEVKIIIVGIVLTKNMVTCL